MRRLERTGLVVAAIIALDVGCATSSRPSPNIADSTNHSLPTVRAAANISFDGSLASYLSAAAEASPRIAAARLRARGATEQARSSGQLPEPTLGYAAFLSRIETRIGPQRHRIRVSQKLPWPGALGAETRAANHLAAAETHSATVAKLSVQRRVRELYWRLWFTRELQTIHSRHQELLRELASSVRTQLEVGRASLAELSHIDLRVAKMNDVVDGLLLEQGSLAAALGATVGLVATETPTVDAPRLRVPSASDDDLRERSAAHPARRNHLERAMAASSAARATDKRGLPSIILGADYIEVGPREGTDSSGKDAVAVTVGLTLPIFRDRYSGQSAAARARSRASDEEARQLALSRGASVTGALASIRDSLRRAKLYETTLIPQAETAYDAAIGQYRVERTTLALSLIHISEPTRLC